MKTNKWVALWTALALAACGQSGTPPDRQTPPADIVLVGEHIITMDPEQPSASGVAIRGDRIALVGDRADALALANGKTRVIELADRALVPGFIDSHGHASAIARLMDYVNLSSPPVGTVQSIDDLVALLRQRIETQQPDAGTWILGYGYDDSLLAEKRHPDRDDLDRASPDLPIQLMHVSGHLTAVNSAALAAAGISAATPDPPGGVIRRRPGSQDPNGVLEETAQRLMGQRGVTSPEGLEAGLQDMAKHYASFGITTVQDGAAAPGAIAAYRRAAARDPFPLDIAAFRHVNTFGPAELGNFRHEANYVDGFRVAGVKFSLDGSPQGRTAWLTQPYEERPPGVAEDYVAYPTVEPKAYMRRVSQFLANGVPVLVHANGDAAIDLMIDGVEAAVGRGTAPDHRAVIIHAQLMRDDQLDRAKELGIVPSFFSAHTFFWGDWHRRSFGARAENISPTRWAVDKGVPFTVHNDAPVVPPDMMRLLWATVNRETRSGDVIGPAQRATVLEALHAMTLGGAYQYFEENNKGSITAGKQADLVILGADPLTADPATLKDIPVLETIARGQTVFARSVD